MGLLDNCKGLIVGIANTRSLAYGIAKHCHQHGAELAITYQNERLEKNVTAIAEEVNAAHILPCDLTDETALNKLYETLEQSWGTLDFVVHAVAGAKREELEGRYLDTSADGFHLALDISVYTLLRLTRAVEPLLHKSKQSPSILTLSYLGAERAIPNYNIMGVAKAALEASVRYMAQDLGPSGIRVNALSPGPARTLSAAAIPGMRAMLSHMEHNAPLRRNINTDDVGRAAVFPLSSLASGITGEVIHVDAGYNIIGAPLRS